MLGDDGDAALGSVHLAFSFVCPFSVAHRRWLGATFQSVSPKAKQDTHGHAQRYRYILWCRRWERHTEAEFCLHFTKFYLSTPSGQWLRKSKNRKFRWVARLSCGRGPKDILILFAAFLLLSIYQASRHFPANFPKPFGFSKLPKFHAL